MTDSKNNLYLISGPPGSGKSTIADALAASFAFGIHIHCDDIYNMVKGGYQLPWDDKDGFLMDTMFDACIEVCKTYLSKGFVCVIDYVFHHNQLLSFIKKLNKPLSLTILLPEVDVNIDRDKNRTWTIGEERIEFYNHYYQQEMPRFKQFILDNTNLSPEATCQHILKTNLLSSEALCQRLM